MEREVRPSQLKESQIIRSDSAHYQIMGFNGEGCFGKVAKCLNLAKQEEMAVKIFKVRGEYEAKVIKWEVKMLKAIRTLDPNKTNIVRFVETFKFQNLSCLVFEMLDMSLWDLMSQRRWKPLSLNEIRPVIHQLFVAFDALKRLGIMYTDLKLDNVMLVNHRDQPFKIKLIDFGLAIPESKAETGMAMQPCTYRAPEVILGLPLSTAIDMWSVGCLMTVIFFGQNIFNTHCSYNWMKVILHLLGKPDNEQLNVGKYTKMFFTREDGPNNPVWRFKTPKEYKKLTGFLPFSKNKFLQFKDLDDAVHTQKVNDDPMEFHDRMVFLNILKRILYVNSEERITPKEAMKHSFITMAHLVEVSTYADTAFQLMTMPPLSHDQSYDSLHTESSTQGDSGHCITADSLEPPHVFLNADIDVWSSSDEDPSDEEYSNNFSKCSNEKSNIVKSIDLKPLPVYFSLSSINYDNEEKREFPHSDVWSSSDEDSCDEEYSNTSSECSDEESNTDKSIDRMPLTVYFSRSNVNNENNEKRESPHSAQGEPYRDMSSHGNSATLLAASDLHDGFRDTAPSSKEESAFVAFSQCIRITECLSVSNNTSDTRTVLSIFSRSGAAAAIKPTEADNVNTGPGETDISSGPDVDEVNTGPYVSTDTVVDKVSPGSDVDKISPGSDVDQVRTGHNVDKVSPGPGRDEVRTGHNVDKVSPGPGRDEVRTGCDVDKVSTGTEADKVSTDTVVDKVSPGPDADKVSTDSDVDEMSPGTDVDKVSTDSDVDEIGLGTDADGGSPGTDVHEFMTSRNVEKVSSGPGRDEVGTGPDGNEIKTSADRSQRKTFCRRVRKFFSRVRKTMLSIFICGKPESAD